MDKREEDIEKELKEEEQKAREDLAKAKELEAKAKDLERRAKEEKKNDKDRKLKKKNILIIVLVAIIVIIILLITSKDAQIELKVKSTLEKIVEKSQLETASMTYNVIAKKCKDEAKCDMTSNYIDDFEFVVSCRGTVTAGIDFSKVKIDVDSKEKKLIVTMPEATITDTNVGSVKFLNGDELPSSILPDARKLCASTVKDRSEKDAKLIPAAKEQAAVVLESFYQQWIKSYDKDYKVEVR